MTSNNAAFKSPFFQLEQVADGIYAALETDPLWTLGNAGIVDLGDQTLIFDTLCSPQAAVDLRAAAEQLTATPITWVVNSHRHGDHYLGNQVFPGAKIVSSTGTRAMLEQNSASSQPFFLDLPSHVQVTREYVRGVAEAMGDENKRRAMLAHLDALERDPEAFNAYLDRLDQNRRQHPALKLALPQLTFDDRLTIHGSRQEAVLVSAGAGHTKEGDVFLWLPDSGVIFAGDLIVYETHPWMGNGDPDHWHTILDQLKALGAEALVPGHGPVVRGECVGQAIDAMHGYLSEMVRLIQEPVTAGKTKSEVEGLPIPAAYQEWSASYVFPWNVSTLWDMLSAPK